MKDFLNKKTIREQKWIHETSMTVSSEEEYYMKEAMNEEEIKKNYEQADARQLTKDRENQLLWEEEYKKERIWKEEHWVCLEGGEGYYD